MKIIWSVGFLVKVLLSCAAMVGLSLVPGDIVVHAGGWVVQCSVRWAGIMGLAGLWGWACVRGVGRAAASLWRGLWTWPQRRRTRRAHEQALITWLEGPSDAASVCFATLAQHAKEPGLYHVLAADAAHRQGHDWQALAHLKRAALACPKAAYGLRLREASYAVHRQHWEEAERLLSDAVRERPKHGQVWDNLWRLYEAWGAWERALSRLPDFQKTAKRVVYRAAEARLWQGYLLSHQHEPSVYHRVWQAVPEHLKSDAAWLSTLPSHGSRC